MEKVKNDTVFLIRATRLDREVVDAAAAEQGVSASEVIRQALRTVIKWTLEEKPKK